MCTRKSENGKEKVNNNVTIKIPIFQNLLVMLKNLIMENQRYRCVITSNATIIIPKDMIEPIVCKMLSWGHFERSEGGGQCQLD